MSRNYELLRKAGDAIHAQRRTERYMPPFPPSGPLPRTEAPSEESRELDLNFPEMLQAILRRRKWIYLWTAVMLTAAALVCVFMKPQYKAESKVEILKQDTSGLSLNNGASNDASSDPLDFNMTLQTQLAVLKSDSLAWQVMKELQLIDAKDAPPPDVSNNPGQPNGGTIAPDKESARALKQFKSNLKLNPISGTRLISVSYMYPDPKMAAKIVNQLVSDLIEYNFQVRYNATTKATDWLGRQLVDLKAQLEASQQRAAELQKQSGIFGQDEHNNIVLTRLEQLNNQVTSAEADRVTKETVYRLSRTGNPELIAGMIGTQPDRSTAEAANPASLLNNLRQQEATLNAEYADASAKYGAAYPRLIQIKEKLRAVRSSISAELGKVAARAKDEYELAAAREAAARKAFDEQKALAAQMNDKATDFLIAKHEAESNRVLYDHLLEKLKEAAVLAGLHSNALHVVDSASVPSMPARPNVPLYLGVGAMTGVLFGLASVFVVDSLDRSIRNVQDLETTTRVPVLGVIPDARAILRNASKLSLKSGVAEASRHNRRDSAILSLGNPAVAEAFRAVRTSLLLSRLDDSCKVLMVTSGMPQEGKSFVSLNLAAAFTNNGARVLLVDADMRSANLSRILDQCFGIGLWDVIRGASETNGHARSGPLVLKEGFPAAYRQIEEVPGLTFMPAGDCPCHAAELLGSEQMSTVIENWRNDFDYVVIDTPPAVPVTDPVILSRKVDAVIVVVRFAVTSQPCIQRTIRLLSDVQAPRMGALMNAMDLRSPEYFHYSGVYGTYASDTRKSGTSALSGVA